MRKRHRKKRAKQRFMRLLCWIDGGRGEFEESWSRAVIFDLRLEMEFGRSWSGLSWFPSVDGPVAAFMGKRIRGPQR